MSLKRSSDYLSNPRKTIYVDPEKSCLWKHAIFVRWMEKNGLADCVSYFPVDMILSGLWSVPPAELFKRHGIVSRRDRERIFDILARKEKECHSDSEVSFHLWSFDQKYMEIAC